MAARASVIILLAAVWLPAVSFAEELVPGRQFDCLIDPARVVKLGSPVTGVLSEVLVNRGDVVKKGQVVAKMDQDIEQVSVDIDRLRAESTAEVDAQVSRNELIGKELDRVKTLMKTGASTQQRLDDLTAQLQIGVQELQRLKLQHKLTQLSLRKSETLLEQRVLRSPIDGVVQQRVLTGGEFVSQQSHVLVIAQLDPLLVESFLPVEHYQVITKGQIGRVTTYGAIEGSHEATVTVIDRVFDAASKTFGVRLELRNQDYALPAGQVCKVAFSNEVGDGSRAENALK